jgi:predicted small lipoprotein YifL
MKEKRVSVKMSTLLLMLTLILSLVGCGKKYEAVIPDKDITKIVVDKNYTEDLKKERGVQEGQIYVQNGMVIATIVLNDKISDENAKKLAEEYATKLKKTYKDMKVNVQAVKDGKNVSSITLEKE